ncbi:Metallo-dependent hydrolase [Trametes coccinea BRFM310]|uniref:Metallo-dependent hydrolase n=1 Tax=Trametes coccinea (strain BRFM310) TaxID=1353009 RepID=A0A1Y2IZW6_TRAC3|nr:Metallo-dependent hydrolase [Trametes coccinea BRFM310]
MCPPNGPSEGDNASAASQRTPPRASASLPSAEELQRELDKVPRAVLAHVVDVHCHPTDSKAEMTHRVVEDLPIRICAMATRRSDQELVADLARAHPDKVVPCFGYHPWFYHWISLATAASKEAHYRALFLPSSAPSKPELDAAFERLLPYLPDPTPLSDVLEDVRSHLIAFPNAMLGEVGIDRVCRIPYTRPADPPYAEAADTDDGSSRELSPFTIPLEHQLAVLEAQLALAVELKRNVSLHSVKCQQATGELLDRMKAKHGSQWLKISVDLHSCGLSAQTWEQLSKRHPNVFLSLSTAINARSPAHRTLIAACAPDRILVESDFHDVRLSAPYTWHMLRTVAEVKGWHVEEEWDENVEEWGAVRRLEENWRMFVRGEHRERTRRKERRDRAIEEWEANAEGD